MISVLKPAILSLFFKCLLVFNASAQYPSVAKQWNEAALTAIRGDFARPTVHARNLFHISIAMYDAWAVYDDTASTYFLGHSFRHFYCPFDGISKPENVEAAREEAISYAAYRLLSHRFQDSPAARQSLSRFDALFRQLGYDATYTSTDYSAGSAAALGNYIAEQIIAFGLQDGSNEAYKYQNTYYTPINAALNPFMPGNPDIKDPNRWQPLALDIFIDQSGNPTGDGPPPFLSPEWGKVVPFALKEEDLSVHAKKGNKYWVYHDPGMPPLLNAANATKEGENYQWNFSLVAAWGAHLDPDDEVMMDISPASIGNIRELPATDDEFKQFFHVNGTGAMGTGYDQNPVTGASYEPQIVPRGDYTRVLAEYWADGPDSETPPGHWFTILNYVSYHPKLERRIGGKGAIIGQLEWDVKAYLTLGGAVHDAAITAWGIKGYYDYTRPISAIRSMAQRGQSSNPELPSYHPAGIPLFKGYAELVESGDPLAGYEGRNINKIKIFSWRGPSYIQETESGKAGVGWILAEEWWPYQRPTFVTPPFAGYVSGHSTFSRAAAEVLSLFTGDEFFPGGMSEFKIYKNRFLVFEKGPTVDMVLQWAKYKDAADQCSLSRIWGGIHPPVDDIPGRIIGGKTGANAFAHASRYFDGTVLPEAEPERQIQLSIYPNPLPANQTLFLKPEPFIPEGRVRLVNILGQTVYEKKLVNNIEEVIEINPGRLLTGIYLLVVESKELKASKKVLVH